MKPEKLVSYQNLILVASIVPIIVFGFLTYYNSKSDTRSNTFEYIKNINDRKSKIALDYFKSIEFDATNLIRTTAFLQKQATKHITNIQQIQKEHIEDIYHETEKDIISLSKKDIFQYIYSFKNRGKEVNPIYIEDLHTYEKGLGLKNVLMINKQGRILYSSKYPNLVQKNIIHLTTTFPDLWKELKHLKHKDKNPVRFSQIGYDKSSDSYKQYVITPFKDVSGFIAMEVDLNAIEKNLQQLNSLGTNAETYLVYKDKNKTFLATNRHIKKANRGDSKSNKYIDLGFTTSNVALKYGSTNNIELVGYMPVKINNLTYSMQTTVPYIDIISPKIKGANFFEQFRKDYEYHNIMLVGSRGDIFYSIEKEPDYKTNILNGEYADTFLSKAVKKVFQTKKFLLTDMNFYSPCPEDIAQFAIIPLLGKKQEVQTIAILQLHTHKLTQLLSTQNTLYKTVETYMVGEDKRLRTDTLLESNEFNVINSFTKDVKIKTDAVNNAFKEVFKGESLEDYRHKNVLSVANLIHYSDVNWALLTEMDEEEMNASLDSLKLNIYIFVLITSFIALFVMFLITNEKKKNDKKLTHQATHDSLTGLPNRKYALEFLSYLIMSNKRNSYKSAILFMDLDKFKVINDTHGHIAGDFVLKEVAKRIKKILRANDLLARLGGDEFIVIMNRYKTANDIDTLCKKIIQTLEMPIVDKNRSYKLGLSIGIATFPNDSKNVTELLMFADTAMYKTKENGRNSYTYYDKKMTELSLHVTQIEEDLRLALQRDELTLYYQPQVSLTTGRVEGVEALVRWNHPANGFMMPNDFIPIAENSNLIIDLGYWVLEKACSDFQKWNQQGCTMNYVAVNMSSKQLQNFDCVNQVTAILHKLNFMPESVEFEITETTLISNFDSIIQNINTFKDMGIKFSIDDFGTGYSSLSYLKSLKISTLKIDRVFIKDMIKNRDDRTIVNAIIAMGHALDYTIIAEGAETKAEIELLKYLACDIVQGYYFSKPLNEKKLLEFVHETNK